MGDLKQAKEHLDKLKASGANEIKWGPLKKWMIKELGVEELPKKGGSHVLYWHPLLEKYEGPPGHFQVALKKNKVLYRKNFLDSTYKVLMKIIALLELEDSHAG